MFYLIFRERCEGARKILRSNFDEIREEMPSFIGEINEESLESGP
jgi:hypothetical protein